MQTKDVADLFLFSVERIEFYWNFFVVSVLVLAGWLITKKRSLEVQHKCMISIGYLLLAGMNLLGLWGSYSAAEALRLDLLAIAKQEKVPLENTIAVLSSNSFSTKPVIATVVHIVIAGLFIVVIWRQSRPDETSSNDAA